MKSFLLMFFSMYICLFSAHLNAQTVPKNVNFALEANTLSWFAGHVGPDLRMVMTKGKLEGYAGAKYSFYHSYPMSRKPDENLLFYRQRFSHGIDFTAGVRHVFSYYSLGYFVQFGQYNYNNTRNICVGGQEVLTEDGNPTGYFTCESQARNNFQERARIYGTGIENRFTLYEVSNFSVYFGITAQFNAIYTDHSGIINETDENGLLTGFNVTKPEFHKFSDRVWLNNIPMFHKTRSISNEERAWFAVKFLLIARYTL